MGLMIKVKCPERDAPVLQYKMNTSDIRFLWLSSHTFEKLRENNFDHVFLGIQVRGLNMKFVFRIREEDSVLIRLMLDISPVLDEEYSDIRNKEHRAALLMLSSDMDNACGIHVYTHGLGL